MTRTIIGRERELAAIERFVNRIPERRAVFIIEGEAGIGKTTLWLEAIAAAELRGYRVLQARPAEREADLSFAAIADLVGTAFDEMRAELSPPQERALAAALLRADPDHPAELRATAAALVTVLTALAATGPLLVAIDDVQWLDPASQRTLEFAARRLPPRLGLLVARRGDATDDAPLALGRALPEEYVERIVLGPLSLAALHHLVRSRLQTSLTRPMLGRLTAASGGNPFFALEIGRALVSGGKRRFDDPMPIPLTMRELAASRVGALSPPAREAVIVASALSRPTVSTVVAALAAHGGARAALAEAEEAEVLVTRGERIRFSHPLLASAVYGSVSGEARRQLHRRLAEVAGDLEERARHLALSTETADEKTATELEDAARQAALRAAPDTAAELFEASWRLTPAELRDEIARRMLGQASALNAIGDFTAATSLAERALESAQAVAVRVGARSLLASVAWFNGAPQTACLHLEQALAESGDDRELLASLHANLVRFNFALDLERALEHADAAVSLLSEKRQPGLLADVLIDHHFASALCGRAAPPHYLERGLALAASAAPVHIDGPSPRLLLWFHCTDAFDAARQTYAAEEQWHRDRGEEVRVADRRTHLALAELRAGDWNLAEAHVEESCAALEQVDVRGPFAMMFEKRALVDAHRGRIERARATLAPLIESFEGAQQPWWAALCLSTLGFVEFAAGDDLAADRALQRMRAHALSIGATDVLFDRSEPFWIEALLALGELDRAKAVLARLEGRGRTLRRLWITVTLPRARALVLAAEGDLESALAALDELEVETASRLPFELGCTRLVHGRLHRRAKHKRAAADALREALVLFEQLGAPTFAERARGELARVGLRRSPQGLTATELRIAQLAAGGLTNREVAKAAFVSPKTVESNLARAYRKLGIRSRAELGARMAVGARGDDTQT